MAQKTRKTRSARPALDRDRIIDAAVAEIDARGLTAFTLRALADRLGVFPTAIYWHVPTKDHILAEVVGAVFRGVAPEGAGRDWRGYFRELFTRYRASIRRHPNVAPLVGAHLIGNLSIDLGFVEGVLGALRHAGLSGARLVTGYNTVIAALIGFVIQEFSPRPQDQAAWQSAVKTRLLGLDPARYPVLAANLPLLANKAFILRWQNGVEAPLDESFDGFVETIIAGIATLAVRPAPRRQTRR